MRILGIPDSSSARLVTRIGRWNDSSNIPDGSKVNSLTRLRALAGPVRKGREEGSGGGRI